MRVDRRAFLIAGSACVASCATGPGRAASDRPFDRDDDPLWRSVAAQWFEWI